MKKLVLLMAILAMILGVSSLGVAQTTEEATQPEAPPETTPSDEAPSPVVDPSTLPCGVSLFRQEQQELVQVGYPTSVSERARECEELGYENPYPAPALLGPDGFVYPYDPIEGKYLYLDPDTGLYYVLDPDSGDVSAYDPVSGTYL